MSEPLQVTLSDIVGLLRKEGISFALIGGQAASLRGEPRTTADVDLVLAIDVEQALGLLDRLESTNFEPLFSDMSAVVQQAFLMPLRHTQTGIKVDLAIGLSGFERQTIERADVMMLAGCQVPVATAEDLIIMKSLAGRPRDEQDLQGIAIAQGNLLDWSYCEQTARELGDAIGVDLVSKIRQLRRDQSHEE